MHIDNSVAPVSLDRRHRARLKLKVGRRSALRLDLAISSSGLLAIGGLVSSILLATAVVVQVATRGRDTKGGSAVSHHQEAIPAP
ncbi:hypothetical protein KCP91_15340 [Microvirga sp. SRT01]|uniref:Uncharacterized protein n=1 Tax=Sphingomonas longa TaxID=2778730 RepID=A0ABS2DCF5_9SPHN|nr:MULTISPECIES: hypothetical protein [Alphaproteobacteria]MBM6577756.1 hypothetical protein [Sphingomonas sp. BT552]MBR7710798.1 hypothetical protein [Microvirga sp. SRT01]